MRRLDASAVASINGAQVFPYRVADSSSCRGALSFDDRELGLNNQLVSLSNMLCVANLTGACSLHVPPLGYNPCGTHMPGERHHRKCTIPPEHAAVDVRKLLHLPADVEALIERGAAFENRTAQTYVGKCRRDENKADACHTCGPYGQNPFKCSTAHVATAKRVFVLYPYGLIYHLRSRRSPEKPSCPLLRLTLHDDVERYTRELMARLNLVPGEFVAAQYRTGWAWKMHTRKSQKTWACYGMSTINATLARLNMDISARPLFLLTNARNLHAETVPVPVQVLSEIRITSLAHAVLLNPESSFREAVVQMRGNREQVYTVRRQDVLQGDNCGCSASDERELEKLGELGALRSNLCANHTAFEEWFDEVRKREAAMVERRREAVKNSTAGKP